MITGCAYVALNYFALYFEKGKDLNLLSSLKSQPLNDHFYDKYANFLSCSTLKYYSLRQENIKENLEHVHYFVNNTLYFEIYEALTLEDLGKIFSEWGNVIVNCFDYL